jgi:hypothetical protein
LLKSKTAAIPADKNIFLILIVILWIQFYKLHSKIKTCIIYDFIFAK